MNAKTVPIVPIVGVPKELLRETRPIVVVLAGLPGLGKSLLAREIEQSVKPSQIVESDWVWSVVCPNGYSPNAAQCGYAMMEAMASAWVLQRITAIIDSTALTRKHRQKWVDMGMDLGVPVHCCFFPPDVEESIRRRDGRGTFAEAGKKIAPERIREMAAKWEEPRVAEGLIVHQVQPSVFDGSSFRGQIGQG